MFKKSKQLNRSEMIEINILQKIMPVLSKNLHLKWVDTLIDMIQLRENKTKLMSIKSSDDIPINIKYGNDYGVANQIWRIIHNPILDDIICTGTGIIHTEIENDIYYNRDTSISRHKSDSISMQQFHNILVKRKTQINIVEKLEESKLNILDIGCGKGGDIPKWIDIGRSIKTVIGIDKSSSNILDKNDGACVRYEQIKNKKETHVPEFTFLVGDCSRNIFNGECFTDDRSKQLYKELWETSMANVYNFKKNKFSIINIQFAIHYFFESMVTVNGFIKNIEENLKVGGYLMGTCFDGHEVFNALKQVDDTDILSGFQNNNIIWKIKKEYELDEFHDDDRSVGIPISVYIKSINNMIREYLVSFEYLQQRFANIGLRVITEREATDLGLSKGTGLFRELYDTYKDDPKYTFIFKKFGDDQQRFSFMYRYFIFKRVSDTSIRLDRTEELKPPIVGPEPLPPTPPPIPGPVPVPPVLPVQPEMSPEAIKWKENVNKLISKIKPVVDISDKDDKRYLSSSKNVVKYKKITEIINKAISKHKEEFGDHVQQEIHILHDLIDILNSRKE